MSDKQLGETAAHKHRAARAIAASRDAAHKHKYALAFWMFAGFALYATIFMPPV